MPDASSLSGLRSRFARYSETLALRLAAGYTLAGLAFVFVATASLYFLLVTELKKSTALFIADKFNVVRTLLRDRPDDVDALHEEIELETSARRYQRFYIRLLDNRGQPLLTTPGMAAQVDLAALTRRARASPLPGFTVAGHDGSAFAVAVAPAPVGPRAATIDTILIAVDVSQEQELLARFRRWFLLSLLAACIFLPLIGYRIALRGIRPVEAMAATARRISSSNLRERILTDGYPFELAALAATFNKMLDGLEDSFERISRFSADIAHDLRTPVNNIRGEAEVALARARSASEYRDVLESCLEEAVRLSNLIGDLLFLARAESPLALLHREPTDVAQLIARVRDYYEASAADAGVSLSAACPGPRVLAAVDGSLLQRALSNLLANAVAHTPAGGSITLTASTEGNALHIKVADTGVGIPPEALPRVFDRFFRADPSRSRLFGGTGLGLAIVQSITLLHGGNVRIASTLGQGTEVFLSLPLTLSDKPSPT